MACRDWTLLLCSRAGAVGSGCSLTCHPPSPQGEQRIYTSPGILVLAAICSLLTVKMLHLLLAHFFPSRIISSNLSALYCLSPPKANTSISGDRALRVGAGGRSGFCWRPLRSAHCSLADGTSRSS